MRYNNDDNIVGLFADMIGALNEFLLDGAIGVVRYIFKIISKIPKWIKEFFLYGIPWLWRKIRHFIRYIFSGAFWCLVWNTLCIVPSLAAFGLAFAWPMIGAYLCGKIDHTVFQGQIAFWSWISVGLLWMSSIGWFGVRYGFKNEFFKKLSERTLELFEPKDIRRRKSFKRRWDEHHRRIKEENDKLQKALAAKREFEKMLARVAANKEIIDQFSIISDLLDKLRNGTITAEEKDKLQYICVSQFATTTNDIEQLIKTNLNYIKLLEKYGNDY